MSATEGGRGDRIALISLIVSATLAGGNAVAVRFSNRELDPMWGATLRFSLAAGLLLLIMAAMRQPLPRGRALLGTVLYGSLGIGVPFAMAYFALVRLHAGLGQTLLALVPLATLLLAIAIGQERMRASAAVGAVVSLAGVALISGGSFGDDVPVPELLATMGAVLGFAMATVIVRRFPKVHPVTMNGLGMAVGAVVLFLGALIAGERIELPQRLATWVSLAYVVPVGSIVVFVLYIVVLRYWAASRAAYQFVLIPFVTVLLSAWLDDEPIGWGLLLGGLLVLAGVYVGALRDAGAESEPSG